MAQTKLENLFIEFENRYHAMVQTNTELNNMDWNTSKSDRLMETSRKFNKQYQEARERLMEEIRRRELVEARHDILTKTLLRMPEETST